MMFFLLEYQLCFRKVNTLGHAFEFLFMKHFPLPDAYVVHLNLDRWIHVSKIQCVGVIGSRPEQNANSNVQGLTFKDTC